MPKSKEAAGLALRRVAAERLRGVLNGASFSPLTAAELEDPRDRALANRLVTAALRYHGPINRLIGGLMPRGMPRKAPAFEPMLRLSLAQLLFLPELGDHSAIFLAAQAMRADPATQHLVKLMNAVLREAQRRREGVELTAQTLFPPALLDIWRRAYGSDAVEAFGRALREGPALDLTLKDLDPGLGASRVLADTVRLLERDRPVDQLAGYAQGKFWVQDAAAAIPARLLLARRGARVLDLCAAPGGKTAQLVKAGYAVTALDRDATRMARLEQNLERLGYRAELVTADALDYAPPMPFDGVLLDAPCSATGTFRRHPEVVWHRDPAGIAARADLQRRLIARAGACLNAGGVLVYCVCSLEPEEGERQADWAAAEGFEPWPITPEELDGWATPVTKDGRVRTHPGQTAPGEKGGTLDGFFVARFRRR
ncbi:MAG TPA: transcription antitermination factor NusB [Hypericibacter adhaerens]|uniref:RsmB/NOP family class I SAM-dependent RNA methyltransferase n=1 Tax=Hypericibacter adhaerens TaxID=2602016 RepID=UPI002C6EB825|nr:transcription antitermination factor NusB [Hypericibacter adhaerens]HWA42076.1 transcription antitermination factor NusB [Hypericibacter adhaerens]